MILTEEEVMILEDMKEIESIQEEIEAYLVEKYGLENLEEGNILQRILSPITKIWKTYVRNDGTVEHTYRRKKLKKEL
jgi:hypothetical protein